MVKTQVVLVDDTVIESHTPASAILKQMEETKSYMIMIPDWLGNLIYVRFDYIKLIKERE